MGGKTKLITVNAVAPTAIVVSSYCRTVVVNEDQSVANWPTVDFVIIKPTSSDQAKRVSAGQAYQFQRLSGVYSAGETIGFIETVSGSSTFAVDEGGEV